MIEGCGIIIQVIDARNPLMFYNEDISAYATELGRSVMSVLIMNKADLISAETQQKWEVYFTKKNVHCFFFSTKTTRDSCFSDKTVIDHVLQLVENKKVKIGVVGFPNVGKSTFINAIFGTKRVAVGATPGKTKHNQTLFFTEDVVIIDCPGLVFPKPNIPEEEYVLNGILSIDTRTNTLSPFMLLARIVGYKYLQEKYKVSCCGETEKECAHSFLEAYAVLRNIMRKAKCGPDEVAAARKILKDAIYGKLLFCIPPEGIQRKALPVPEKEVYEEKINKDFFETPKAKK